MLKKILPLVIIALLPTVGAAIQQQTHFHDRAAYTKQIAALTGVFSAGQIVYQISYPDEVPFIGTHAQISIHATGPPLTGVGGFTMGADFSGVGCTGTDIPRQIPPAAAPPIAVQQGVLLAGPAVVQQDLLASWNLFITITQPTCSAIIAVVLCHGATVPPDPLPLCTSTVAIGDFAVQIKVMDRRVDNLNRLCAASGFNTTCAPADTFGGNLTVAGELTVHQDQACGDTVVCEVNVHQDQACGTTTTCEINAHQDEACGATITCLSNANVTSNIIGSNITNTINANAFDWEAFALKYFPAALAIVMAAVFFRRRDPIFGVIAIALILYSAFAFAWGAVIQTIAMALILYIIVAIIILRKQEKGLQVA